MKSAYDVLWYGGAKQSIEVKSSFTDAVLT